MEPIQSQIPEQQPPPDQGQPVAPERVEAAESYVERVTGADIDAGSEAGAERQPAAPALPPLPGRPVSPAHATFRRSDSRRQRQLDELTERFDQLLSLVRPKEEAQAEPLPDPYQDWPGYLEALQKRTKQELLQEFRPVLDSATQAREQQERYEQEASRRRELAQLVVEDQEGYLSQLPEADRPGYFQRFDFYHKMLFNQFLLSEGGDERHAARRAQQALDSAVNHALRAGYSPAAYVDRLAIGALQTYQTMFGGAAPAPAAGQPAPAAREIQELRQAASAPVAGSVGQTTARSATSAAAPMNAKELLALAKERSKKEGISVAQASRLITREQIEKAQKRGRR